MDEWIGNPESEEMIEEEAIISLGKVGKESE